MDTHEESGAVIEEHRRLIEAVVEARNALNAFELDAIGRLAPGASALVIEGEIAVDDSGDTYFDLWGISLKFGTETIELPNLDDIDYWIESQVESEKLPEEILDCADEEETLGAVMEHLGSARGITGSAMRTITQIAFTRAFRESEATTLSLGPPLPLADNSTDDGPTSQAPLS